MTGASSLMGFLRLIQPARLKELIYAPTPQRGDFPASRL